MIIEERATAPYVNVDIIFPYSPNILYATGAKRAKFAPSVTRDMTIQIKYSV